MNGPSISAKVAAISSSLSPYPASFNGNPWLFAASFAAILAMTMLMLVVLFGKLRTIWIDRYLYHPTQPIFLYRLMMAGITFAALQRLLPELVYYTCHGEVTGDTEAKIMTWRQMMNIIALPTAIGWLGIYVVIDPFVTLALKANMQLGRQSVDFLGNWHRMARPTIALITILMISALMALAKGTLASHG